MKEISWKTFELVGG